MLEKGIGIKLNSIVGICCCLPEIKVETNNIPNENEMK